MDKHCHVYYYWGVKLNSEQGIELIGTCPFCNHDDTRSGKGHFYVNSQSAAFKCQSGSCGKEGSWRDFLTYVFETKLERTTDEQLLILTKEQGIPLPILKKKKIAYDAKRGFLYAIYNEQDNVVDIRRHKKNIKEESVKGSEPGITNLKEILNCQNGTPIYITEGWRDECAVAWLLWRNKQPGITCSVPGANNFRDTWGKYFTEKKLIVCFDNDKAGYGTLDEARGKATGSRKLESYTKHQVKSLQFITWPDDSEESYDPKQFVIDNKQEPLAALKLFESYLTSYHKHDIADPLIDTNRLKHIQVEVTELVDTAKEIYELDKNFIDGFKVALATVVSAKFEGKNPPWVFLVGAPASGKTIILGQFERSTHTIWESTLSSTALISGWGLGDRRNQLDPSILARVNNRCLVLKDFTEVLGKQDTERKEIFDILRGAFDGRVRKPFGTGVRQYITNFTFLAGVTHEIKAHSTADAGERFLQYEMYTSLDEEVIQEKALNAQLFGRDKEKELVNRTTDFLENEYDLSGSALFGLIPRWFRDKIKPLARLTAQLRATVRRHDRGHYYGQLIYIPVKELGNRIVVQLEKLALAMALIEGKSQIDEEIYSIIYKIGMDTCNSINSRLVLYLAKNHEAIPTSEISKRIGISVSHNMVTDLETLRLIEKNGYGGAKPAYTTTKLISDLFDRSRL